MRVSKSAFAIALATLFQLCLPYSESAALDLRGMTRYSVAPGEIPAWRSWAARWRVEKEKLANCKAGDGQCDAASNWRRAIASAKSLSGAEAISYVNQFVNRTVTYRSDPDDYWATPLQTLSSGGDCEDFALLKYLSLRELGFSDSQLVVLVLYDSQARMGHAVLKVASGGRVYLLDNLTDGFNGEALGRFSPRFEVNATSAALFLPNRRPEVSELTQ